MCQFSYFDEEFIAIIKDGVGLGSNTHLIIE